MWLRLTGIWHSRDFCIFWAGQTISSLGNQVTLLALPLVAALVLKVGPAEMGILAAAEGMPTLLLGLLAGAWVDRWRKRPVLVVAALGRAAVLASVPLAYGLGLLSIAQLYGVAIVMGIMATFNQAAHFPFLLSIVRRDRIVEANRSLSLSDSAATIVGPGLAGLLVQAVTAPAAIVADAASFLLSALSVAFVAGDELPRTSGTTGRSIKEDIEEGLRLIVRNPLLRGMAGNNATWAFFDGVVLAVYVLYATRELRLTPALLGLTFVGNPVAFALGNLLTGRAITRLGFGPAAVGGAVIGSVGGVILALAGGPIWLAALVLSGAEFLMGLGGGLYTITATSLQQTVTPDHLLGRMNATMNFLSAGAAPLGALVGGFLGEAIGLRPTIIVGAIGGVAGFLWVWYSPLRTLQNAPQGPEAQSLKHV